MDYTYIEQFNYNNVIIPESLEIDFERRYLKIKHAEVIKSRKIIMDTYIHFCDIIRIDSIPTGHNDQVFVRFSTGSETIIHKFDMTKTHMISDIMEKM